MSRWLVLVRSRLLSHLLTHRSFCNCFFGFAVHQPGEYVFAQLLFASARLGPGIMHHGWDEPPDECLLDFMGQGESELDMPQMEEGPFADLLPPEADWRDLEEEFDEGPPQDDGPAQTEEGISADLPVRATPVRRLALSAVVETPGADLPAQSKRVRLRKKTTAKFPEVYKAVSPQPLRVSFLKHPAFLMWEKLDAQEKKKHRGTLRVRRCRFRELLAQHLPVEIGGHTFAVVEDMHLGHELDKAEMEALLQDANDSEKSMEVRGACVRKFMKLQGDSGAAGPPEAQDHRPGKGNFKSVLLTYNGDWGLFSKQSHVPNRMEDMVEWLQGDPKIEEVLKDRVAWCSEQTALHRIRHWVLSLEISPESLASEKHVRVHLHIWLLLGSAGCQLEGLQFRGSKPHVNVEYSMVHAVRSRAGQAHFAGAFYPIAVCPSLLRCPTTRLAP